MSDQFEIRDDSVTPYFPRITPCQTSPNNTMTKTSALPALFWSVLMRSAGTSSPSVLPEDRSLLPEEDRVAYW